MSLQGMAPSRTIENDSLIDIAMEAMTPPPINKHPQGERPLASICNEESFRAVASSSEIRCSTPHSREEVRNSSSESSKASSQNQTSVTLSLEIGSYQPHTVDLSNRIPVNEGEKDGDKITRNAQQLYTRNDEEMHRSQKQVIDEKMGAYNMLRFLPTEQKSSKGIKRRYNLTPLYCDQKSPEDDQSCSIYLSNQESDLTFVSSLNKSSDFETEDSMKFDNPLKYIHNHKHMSDRVLSESLQHVYERHRYLNNQNASFEQNGQLQRTRKEDDSNKPVIVIDMQPLPVVSSSILACSSETSSDVGRKRHQFNNSQSNLQEPTCTRLLNYTSSSSIQPGINSESQTDADSNKLHSKQLLSKMCNSCGNQNVSEAALQCNVPSQHVHIGDTTIPMLLTTHDENYSDVDSTSFNTVFHHPSADLFIGSYNPFSIIKYDQMGNPYRETMV